LPAEISFVFFVLIKSTNHERFNWGNHMRRRDFLKNAGLAGAGLVLLPGFTRWGSKAHADVLAANLSDPALQPKFVNPVPNALDPGFIYQAKGGKGKGPRANWYKVGMYPIQQNVGLIDQTTGLAALTAAWGYGDNPNSATWPGKTFEVQSGQPIEVRWENKLVDPVTGMPVPHLLPVDTSLHWCYSLPGYTQFSIPVDGVPVVPHLHGGHTEWQSDGNPEYFFSPGWGVRGPRWVKKDYAYANDQPAGTLWYHDHALGITRLNVWAGLAGFYIVRDDQDTGKPNNPLGLPAFPYEAAFAIQDRMFTNTGQLFYSAFPGDPFYDDFITGEGAVLPPGTFPGGGPTALAEFFGDHMVVNGVAWPKMDVEPRNYRLRLLNGNDSRFMVLRFRSAPAGTTDPAMAGAVIPFYVIGSDQGLAESATQTDTLVFEPGSRYDIVIDFNQVPAGSRVIMENLGGDAPFGGDYGAALAPEDLFPNRQTDRIMAFDVTLPLDPAVPDTFNPAAITVFGGITAPETRVRKVALFEGLDEYGRLQPLLGTAEPATDEAGAPIMWPAGDLNAPGQMEGAIAWHSNDTENPALGATEVWEIYNATMDAHPVHLHLVHFEVLSRQEFTADLIAQPVLQHNGAVGQAFRLANIQLGAEVTVGPEYVENAPKDMVTALPGQVTRIKATFDKPGRYVWHCHILSHEDHEMMRVLHVGPGAETAKVMMMKPGKEAVAAAPLAFELKQNYPNPFNPSTTINFSIPADERVQLKIFNSRGQLVRTVVDKNLSAGRHSYTWDGTSGLGFNVASGVYFYRIKAGKHAHTMKMNLVR
jgi:FtsP/CotA-like multicopper oxidase with cupredoxin domain